MNVAHGVYTVSLLNWTMSRVILAVLSALLLAFTSAQNLNLPDGYSAAVVTEGLRGPTQMIIGPDDRLWLAQLAGGENSGTGQVIALSLETLEREVLIDNLLKPTGIAVLDGYLWIAAGRDLLRAPLTETEVGGPETVLSDLPFNGRSNGTLTVTPDGQLLYETSGRRAGNEAREGSGTLWRLNPNDPANSAPIATGLKGAYAHTFSGDGQLFSTEIGDDLVNGQAPPDELNLITEGGNYGWPQCYGDQEAARNYGGTAQQCAETRAPLALFAPNSTPTSVVVSPFEDDTLLVALWGPAESSVVKVSSRNGNVEPFIPELQTPQHLLVEPEGSLLVSDFSRGTLYRIMRD